MKFIVLGPTGNVGSSLIKQLAIIGAPHVAIKRNLIEDHTFDSLSKSIEVCENDVFVNCVAYMSADQCEINPLKSKETNVDFVEKLVFYIANFTNSKLIHLSTDFVFSGIHQNSPYLPSDNLRPLNTYGIHKAESEEIVLRYLGNRARIIRISSYVGNSIRQSTFLDKVESGFKSGHKLRITNDLTISVSSDLRLAQSINQAFSIEDLVQHSSYSGETSWSNLAHEFFKLMSYESNIVPIGIADLNLPAHRPIYSVLMPTSYPNESSIPTWKEGLAEFVSQRIRHNQ